MIFHSYVSLPEATHRNTPRLQRISFTFDLVQMVFLTRAPREANLLSYLAAGDASKRLGKIQRSALPRNMGDFPSLVGLAYDDQAFPWAIPIHDPTCTHLAIGLKV